MTHSHTITEQLRSRNYPAIYAELHLAVSSSKQGEDRFVLTLRQGRASVQPGGYGRIRVAAADLMAVLERNETVGGLMRRGGIVGPDEDCAKLQQALDG